MACSELMAHNQKFTDHRKQGRLFAQALTLLLLKDPKTEKEVEMTVQILRNVVKYCIKFTTDALCLYLHILGKEEQIQPETEFGLSVRESKIAVQTRLLEKIDQLSEDNCRLIQQMDDSIVDKKLKAAAI